MKKNRIIVAFLIVFSASSLFAAKKSIVCTSFPEYDWTLNILGKKSADFEITLLQNNGTDLHSYQPSFKDIAKITACDLFIYVGGESDKWVEKVLSNSKNKKQIAINLMEQLGSKALEEEIVEGMEAEDSEDEEETEYDEHIWLSLKNAAYFTQVISAEIQKMDASNQTYYKQTTSIYVNKLNALDSLYSKVVSTSKYDTVLFADRFPFRYLTEDYGLKYFAAFVGCSAESEASFKTMAFLSKKVDELGIPAVIVLEKSSKKIAQTVIANTKSKKQQILEMDSLQSVTQKDIADGETYLSVMENNLEILKKALN